MRKSQRLVGQPPEDSNPQHLSQLLSIRSSRRGLMGSLTRTINQILMHLNSGDIQTVTNLQNRMMDTFMKFRAINTEYMSLETDPRKVRECEEVEQREANRISEVEKEIRLRMRSRSFASSNNPAIFLDDIPVDQASIGSGGSGYESPRYYEGRQSTPFPVERTRSIRLPTPPSVSSLTAKPRSSFRRLRQTPPSESYSDSLSHSSATVVVDNQAAISRPQSVCFQPIDKFIDDLIEGEETCLAGLSKPLTASAALRYEFESKTLPVVELTNFNGDSSKWPEFIENFSRRIHF